MTVYENNKSIKELTEKRGFDAQKTITNALSRDPLNPVLQFNLGLTFEVNREPEKARQIYESLANSSAPPIIKFQSNFNAARIYGEERNYDKAFEHYQAALDIDPQSKETKTNIELLLQQQASDKSQQQKDGQGGGKSDQDQKNQGDNEKQDDKKDQNQQGKNDQKQNEQKKKKPKPFDGQQLSEKEVEKILEELNRQEQQIRAKSLSNEKTKEVPVEKDW